MKTDSHCTKICSGTDGHASTGGHGTGDHGTGDFAGIADYAQLRASLAAVAAEIAAADRKLTSWKSLLLPAVRWVRRRLKGES